MNIKIGKKVCLDHPQSQETIALSVSSTLLSFASKLAHAANSARFKGLT
ncbi:hypothetical protein [Aurantiacibacter luteus]|nr:hypothetical protein [Aurantiacibacter luteus]